MDTSTHHKKVNTNEIKASKTETSPYHMVYVSVLYCSQCYTYNVRKYLIATEQEYVIDRNAQSDGCWNSTVPMPHPPPTLNPPPPSLPLPFCMKVFSSLIDWGRVTHICVNNLIIIGSDMDVSNHRFNDGILLIGPVETNFNDILIEMYMFSLKKIHLKVLFAKWRPFVSAPMSWASDRIFPEHLLHFYVIKLY